MSGAKHQTTMKMKMWGKSDFHEWKLFSFLLWEKYCWEENLFFSLELSWIRWVKVFGRKSRKSRNIRWMIEWEWRGAMVEKDVFVKRVDFDLHGKDDNDIKTPLNEVNNSDVEKLTDTVIQKPGCFVRFLVFIDKYGIKAALSHIGLLISLGLYCYGGGYVIKIWYLLTTSFSKHASKTWLQHSWISTNFPLEFIFRDVQFSWNFHSFDEEFELIEWIKGERKLARRRVAPRFESAQRWKLLQVRENYNENSKFT